MRRVLDVLISAAGLIALWALLVRMAELPPYMLPSPWRVAQVFWNDHATLWRNAKITAWESLAGFALGASAGIAAGLLLTISSLARRWLGPFLVLSQSVPTFALAPLIVLWLGFGPESKIVVAALGIYFVVASNFYDGLRRTDPGLLDLARVMGASPRRELWRLRIPAALPSLGSGLKVAAAYAPIAAAVGEWAGASQGLGYLMLYANARLKIDLMFAALLTLAVFGLAFHALVGWAARRMTSWAPEAA
ncbi:ABC transporter permease [Neomegalonema perideroedes]|uniref:ABC transporter permease n=1 Tax=Neomegalonema perideroedes TaxID=217219 RepID=UPI0003615625|nr:ABC transporter permease [Neomegalonema perideroedes]